MALKTEITKKALKLPQEDRAELARQLIHSLDPAEVDADTDDACEAEIGRRLDAYHKGDVKPVDWPFSSGMRWNCLSGNPMLRDDLPLQASSFCCANVGAAET